MPRGGARDGAGRKPLDVQTHLMRGTFRADRHADAGPLSPVSKAERRRTLHGLSPVARRIAAGLLDEFTGWHAGTLATVRLYAQSAARLQTLEPGPAFHAELKATLALLGALRLRAPHVVTRAARSKSRHCNPHTSPRRPPSAASSQKATASSG